MVDVINDHTTYNGTKIAALEESDKKTATPMGTVEEATAKFNQKEAWEELNGKTNSLEKQVSKIEDKIVRFDEKIQDSNLKVIETLGIFVALFTFVSVSFNIFSRISDLWSAGIFVLLIFFVLSLMILLLDILLNRQKNLLDFRFILFTLFIILMIGSLYLLRSFPINPIPNTLEFETSIDKKLDSKIENYLNENNKNFYHKLEIDRLLKQPIINTPSLKKENRKSR